jgi:hypothetical protein
MFECLHLSRQLPSILCVCGWVCARADICTSLVCNVLGQWERVVHQGLVRASTCVHACVCVTHVCRTLYCLSHILPGASPRALLLGGSCSSSLVPCRCFAPARHVGLSRFVSAWPCPLKPLQNVDYCMAVSSLVRSAPHWAPLVCPRHCSPGLFRGSGKSRVYPEMHVNLPGDMPRVGCQVSQEISGLPRDDWQKTRGCYFRVFSSL